MFLKMCESCNKEIPDADIQNYRKNANGGDDYGIPTVCSECADVFATNC